MLSKCRLSLDERGQAQTMHAFARAQAISMYPDDTIYTTTYRYSHLRDTPAGMKSHAGSSNCTAICNVTQPTETLA